MEEKRPWLTRVAILAPYAWLAAFFLLPFLIVVKISLSQTALAQPPYLPLLDLSAGWEGVKEFLAALTRDNYVTLFTDSLYIWSYGKSLTVAAVSTAILLVVAYPVAYALARAPRRWQGALVLLVVLPFWTSFLIRVYAWVNILQREGLLNTALQALGLIDQPVTWLATDTAVYIGIVYS
jgi:putrescine transport system permease protein